MLERASVAWTRNRPSGKYAARLRILRDAGRRLSAHLDVKLGAARTKYNTDHVDWPCKHGGGILDNIYDASMGTAGDSYLLACTRTE